MDNRPIGMFDSGIGGLTVLKEFLKIMPNENYIYYADTKHLPYGEKTQEQIISYVEEIMHYFIKQNVKAIMIACGTASSLAYPVLKEKYKIPLFDIITPVIKEIHTSKVGIIATTGSVKSHVWENEIHKAHKNVTVFTKACPKLVPLAEKGLAHSFLAEHTLHAYLKDFKPYNIDSCILGCTHYPLFSEIIQKELGNDVTLMNMGTAAAQTLQQFLIEQNQENENHEKGTILYKASGNQSEFMKKVKKIIYQKDT